jgi:hypothetical protein
MVKSLKTCYNRSMHDVGLPQDMVIVYMDMLKVSMNMVNVYVDMVNGIRNMIQVSLDIVRVS